MYKRLGTIKEIAAEIGVSPRAIRYMVAKGYAAPVAKGVSLTGAIYDMDQVISAYPIYQEKIYKNFYRSSYYGNT